MIVRSVEVGSQTDRTELRIRRNKVFGEVVGSQHGALNVWSNRGERGIPEERSVVIECVEDGRDRTVIPIGKIRLKVARYACQCRGRCAQVHCSRLPGTIEEGADRSISGAGN